MQPLTRFLRSLAFLIACFAGLAGAARAADLDLSHAVLLVASARQANSVYEKTVMLAAPLPDGGHVGIIINRPAGVKLETLFPDQASARKVVDEVYLGGQTMPRVLLALTKEPPPDSNFVQLMPGLVAVLDGASVDRIIDTKPNDARYFLGFTLWPEGALANEIHSGNWTVRPADAHSVLPASTSELWLLLSDEVI
jgi:putative AlgH/UPF0301 family transcriptional regulator